MRLSSTDHRQGSDQEVFYQNCIPSRSRYRHSNKLWAQWHLISLRRDQFAYHLWHQRIELLEVLVEMLLALAIRLQICGRLNAPTELLTGVLQPWKDKLGGIIGLARISVTKGRHLCNLSSGGNSRRAYMSYSFTVLTFIFQK